jgi:hypothetical protein
MTIPDTKPKRRRKPSSKSSSSAKTALSKTPADVLALGQHLVRELNVDDRGDTLGRWMAHYIAELIAEVEKSTSKKERLAAQQRAMAAILRIWEHRESLPGYAYPLAKYDGLLSVLDRLRPDNNPFRFNQMRESKSDQAAAILFDHLTRLVMALLFMKIDSLKLPMSDAVAIDALDDDEKNVLNSFYAWVNFFAPAMKSSRGRAHQKTEATREIDVRQVALELLIRIEKETAELRQTLAEREIATTPQLG